MSGLSVQTIPEAVVAGILAARLYTKPYLINLRSADLSYANLRSADLSYADLSYANLRSADLSDANLSDANLRSADLSGSTGLLDPVVYLKNNFEFTDKGIIVYKTFAMLWSPGIWEIEPGAILEEVVNPIRTSDCACGVNVATKAWILDNTDGEIWQCLIRWSWLAGVVIPYHTDGQIRASRVELVEKVSREDLSEEQTE